MSPPACVREPRNWSSPAAERGERASGTYLCVPLTGVAVQAVPIGRVNPGRAVERPRREHAGQIKGGVGDAPECAVTVPADEATPGAGAVDAHVDRWADDFIF